ncbi:hypothetical protein B0A54_13872 [Friedmanniomyces endolithicus]|uniref:N-acetyltransferase domain-containing protein n=1 Tax=Friedmanniomyces endolithicus TaxID=329885 RepID=A0A4V5N832_9PEZI|nr:hypothetical protein LTS09_001914 [Friedmanniomyces endolithicus]KAK0312945.1 hypothetical protein LTR01_002608 [Friedmanniomyces endolithicus]TKA34909.1 hypothetical protein B0A54_13872 [Friedmanniomyces endolithicus]
MFPHTNNVMKDASRSGKKDQAPQVLSCPSHLPSPTLRNFLDSQSQPRGPTRKEQSATKFSAGRGSDLGHNVTPNLMLPKEDVNDSDIWTIAEEELLSWWQRSADTFTRQADEHQHHFNNTLVTPPETVKAFDTFSTTIMTPANGTRPLPPHLRARPSTHAESDGKKALPPHLRPRVPTLPPHLRPRPSTQTETACEAPVPQESAASFHDSVISPLSPPNTKSSRDDIRAKLSTFGVKISAPKPVAASVIDGKVGGKHSSTQEPRQPSLASRGRGTVNAPKTSDQAETAADIHREALRAPSRNQCRQGRDGRKPPRASKWPTSKELAAPKPRKHDKGPMTVSGWSIDAAQADLGVGGIRAPADEIGFKLTDWNGDWAPAPLNWDARPPFTDPSKVAHIERWLREMECDVRPASADTLLSTDELAPRYWVPKSLASQSPTAYFKQLVASNEPAPVDTDDLVGAIPWWKLYQTDTSSKLQPYPPPILAGVDPDETPDERLARENDYGADKHLENKKRTESAKKAAKREQKAKKLAKAENGNPTNRSATKRIKPALNLYLRSARPTDLDQVRDIYNHYIAFTSCAPETQPLTTLDMQARLDNVKTSGLPLLIACERGGKVPARRSRRNYDGEEEDLILPDRVVGFALAQEFGDDGLGGMYRFACEIRVFVKQECYMKGVGKCLVDKLLALLDPGYAEAGGFEVQGEELEGGCVPRVVQSVVARVPYERPERLEWTGRWLRSLGFEQVADLPGIGVKDGKGVSLAMFMRKTGAVVVDGAIAVA